MMSESSTAVLDESEPLVSDVFTGADPAAPYGRFKNGKPRKNPPKGVSAPRASKTSYRAKTKTDYRPGLMGMAQVGTLIASFINPLDAIAVQDHAPNIVEGAQITADNVPAFAAKLDKFLAAGPYAALLTPVAALVVQILHNHDRVPGAAVKAMGGRTKEEVIAELSHAQAA